MHEGSEIHRKKTGCYGGGFFLAFLLIVSWIVFYRERCYFCPLSAFQSSYLCFGLSFCYCVRLGALLFASPDSSSQLPKRDLSRMSIRAALFIWYDESLFHNFIMLSALFLCTRVLKYLKMGRSVKLCGHYDLAFFGKNCISWHFDFAVGSKWILLHFNFPADTKMPIQNLGIAANVQKKNQSFRFVISL